MKKEKLLPCPFCGNIPKAMKFCSTAGGPALMCDHCGAEGPPALNMELVGSNEVQLTPRAIKVWNKRALDSESYRRGIEAAASYVEQFDKYVQHGFRLSDCILGKFNLIGTRKLRKNIPEQRTPIRRKKDRRNSGGPTFVLGSMLSRERRERQKREGVVRRRS